MVMELAAMMSLKEARMRRQWRREDLASKADVGLTTIIRAETGKRVPRYPVRLALATALGVTVDEIEWGKSAQAEELGDVTNE